MPEGLSTTRFFVLTKKISGKFVDGNDFHHRGTLVNRNDKGYCPYFDLNLRRIQRAECFFEKEKHGFLNSIQFDHVVLPEKIQQAIRTYFQENYEGNPGGGIDCFSFACLVEGLGIPPRKPNGKVVEDHLDRWDFSPEKHTLRVGDTCFFWEREPNTKMIAFKHAAVHVGYKMFLSVYGLDGELLFSDENELKKTFNANVVTKMVPIKE